MPFYPTKEKMAAPSSSVTTQIPICVSCWRRVLRQQKLTKRTNIIKRKSGFFPAYSSSIWSIVRWFWQIGRIFSFSRSPNGKWFGTLWCYRPTGIADWSYYRRPS
jgi:hypothetical protein